MYGTKIIYCTWVLILNGFVVGPSEENEYTKPLLSPQTHPSGKSNQGIIQQSITGINQSYFTINSEIKKIWTSDLCPHTYGCLYYILSVSKILVFKQIILFHYTYCFLKIYLVRNKIIFSWLYTTIKFEVLITSQPNFTLTKLYFKIIYIVTYIKLRSISRRICLHVAKLIDIISFYLLLFCL